MKQLLIVLVLILASDNFLVAQQWWERFSKQERENILLENAKQAILNAGDERYYTMHRGYRIDSIMYRGILTKLQGRELYRVYFLYDSTKVKFRKSYLSMVRVLKDNGEIVTLSFGNGRGTSAHPKNKVPYEEMTSWEVQMMNFLLVFQEESIDAFKMVTNDSLLLPAVKVEIKQLVEHKGNVKLCSTDDRIFTFTLSDDKCKRCFAWLEKAAKEKVPVLLSLVKYRDNEIGQVTPPIREIGEHFKARSEQNE